MELFSLYYRIFWYIESYKVKVKIKIIITFKGNLTMNLTQNINEKANLIWAIADKLTGVYKPHEYGEVILPLTVIRRFDCILEPTKDAVVEKNKNLNIAVKD